MARSKYVKPENPSIVRARVAASERVSPHFVRVTVTGPELDSIAPMGADQWFRLFLPRPGQTELRLPTASSKMWYAQFKLMPEAVRPIVRNYTIRALRTPGAGRFGEHTEIDIDFADHGDTGPASQWARSASEGDEVGLLDEGLIYNPPAASDWHLLVGDESALPAIAGILDSAPEGFRAHVFVEIPDERDRQEVTVPDGVEMRWIVRTSAEHGMDALAAVREAELPAGRAYTFVAGESALPTELRRHLVRDRGFDKGDISFTGFWRRGHAAS
ncbi:siderophore-interacting protein [Rhodococcus sp. HNM0569]|uniref:siderophore-interacting protein n=1 Tax=Rhodococcus sp. HNM0569 TaxID=2716340 RepID=UPI00146C39D4|nr:siderophore-interacting protein [Rhodococcus sp. HNM0569]NLU84174.1 siderophore-interacting protein [Rhodococcus sp. HNM0569]